MKARQHLLAAGLGAMAVLALPAQAQTASHHLHAAPSTMPRAAQADMTEGEVRKIDRANRKITFRHGAIKNLDMPPMTMAFQAADPSLLDKVKVGDKVRFVATNPGGKLTVNEIEPVK